MTIWALHGFLGLPSDFESLKEHCIRLQPDLKWHSVDYLKVRELSPQNPLASWGAHFNQYVQKSSEKNETHVLLGYSQGGRLALHALKDNPSLWKSTILLSANPGILEGERPARLANDQRWANQFLNENFAWTLKQWNSQNVFRGSKNEPQRSENQFNRHQLADCLVNWSVAQQENFAAFLNQSSSSILYVAGERDTKYVQIGQAIANANRRVDCEILADSGHRVLFDQPIELSRRIIRFLTKKNS